jgi:outer membrane protein TolC
MSIIRLIWKQPLLLLASLPAWGEPALDLETLIARARDQNPEIRAAHQAWKVAQAQVGPARAWPDPMLSITRERYAGVMMETDADRSTRYRIDQAIPFPGKLTQEARMKHHEALIAESRYRARLLDVVQELRRRYYQLYLVDRQTALAQQSVDTLRNALQTAQNRMASGKSSALDVFMAQTELHRMENELYAQKQQRRLVNIELNTILNQPTDTIVGAAAKPAFVEIAASSTTLRSVAERNSPDYQRAMHEVNHSRTMRSRARLGWAPDFSVMAERETPNAGRNGQQIGVGVAFPLWVTRPWGETKTAREHELETAADAQAAKNATLKSIDMEVIEVETRLNQVRRYEATILPSALSALRTARQQYASGQTEFVRFLEALRSWLQTHTQYEQMVYEYGEHWSELSRSLGVDAAQVNDVLKKPEESHAQH